MRIQRVRKTFQKMQAGPEPPRNRARSITESRETPGERLSCYSCDKKNRVLGVLCFESVAREPANKSQNLRDCCEPCAAERILRTLHVSVCYLASAHSNPALWRVVLHCLRARCWLLCCVAACAGGALAHVDLMHCTRRPGPLVH